MAELISATLEYRRCLSPWGFAAEYTLTWSLAPGELARVCTSLVHGLIVPLGLAGESCTNFKGRDPQTVLHPEWFPIPAVTDELLAIFSTCSDADAIPEQCSLLIESSFLDFPDRASIRYRLAPHLHGQLPDWLDSKIFLQLAGWIAPLQTTGLRFGLNTFRSRFMTSFFGYVPALADSISIEAKQTQLSLRLSSDGLKTKQSFPLGHENLREKLDETLQACLGFQLLEDFDARIARAS